MLPNYSGWGGERVLDQRSGTACKANINRRENGGRGCQFGQVSETMAGPLE